MSDITISLVKRGYQAHSYMKEKQVKIEIPGWAIVLLATTALVFVGILFMIDYTFGQVIPTLVMVESPQDSINFEAIPTEDTDDSVAKDPEPTVSKPQLITSSFRRTIQLLQSKGGFRARFRGFWIFIVNSLVVQWLAAGLSLVPILNYLPPGFTTVIATVLCAQLSMGWTHIVISEPSPKPWFRRLPNINMWKKIAGPTALFAIAQQLSLMLPLYLAISVGLTRDPNDVANLPVRDQKAIVCKSIGIFALGLILACLVVIPANVTLTRIQASLLRDTDETIVPFDRSFGGKVIPEIVGGSGQIGLLDAWKTFDWAARIRLIKTFAKSLLMQIGAIVLFTIIFVAQILMIGPSKMIVPVDGQN